MFKKLKKAGSTKMEGGCRIDKDPFFQKENESLNYFQFDSW